MHFPKLDVFMLSKQNVLYGPNLNDSECAFVRQDSKNFYLIPFFLYLENAVPGPLNMVSNQGGHFSSTFDAFSAYSLDGNASVHVPCHTLCVLRLEKAMLNGMKQHQEDCNWKESYSL